MSATDALGELRALALKAREWQHTEGECLFVLRTPTRLEVREMTHQRGLLQQEADAMVVPLLQQYLLQRAIVAWTGVRHRDLVADAGDAPLPWSAEAVALYLDANPELADRMGALLLGKVQQRGESLDADAKN